MNLTSQPRFCHSCGDLIDVACVPEERDIEDIMLAECVCRAHGRMLSTVLQRDIHPLAAVPFLFPEFPDPVTAQHPSPLS